MTSIFINELCFFLYHNFIAYFYLSGYYDRDGKLVMVSDASLQLLGPAFSASFGLKGHCWAVCYHNVTSGPKLWRVIVPKHIEKVTDNKK